MEIIKSIIELSVLGIVFSIIIIAISWFKGSLNKQKMLKTLKDKIANGESKGFEDLILFMNEGVFEITKDDEVNPTLITVKISMLIWQKFSCDKKDWILKALILIKNNIEGKVTENLKDFIYDNQYLRISVYPNKYKG